MARRRYTAEEIIGKLREAEVARAVLLQDRGTDMAWHVSGQSVELCNCKLMCPCWISDTATPDHGACIGAFAWDVQTGESDGVDLAGTKVAFRADWPGNFGAGQGTARLYLDASANADQRRELEAIFSGQKGGVLEGVWGAVITTWLPARETSIDMQWGDSPSVTVGDVGQVTLQPIKDAAGQQTTVRGAAMATALQLEGLDVASSQGTRWTDPDLQTLEGDSGSMSRFDWTG